LENTDIIDSVYVYVWARSRGTRLHPSSVSKSPNGTKL